MTKKTTMNEDDRLERRLVASMRAADDEDDKMAIEGVAIVYGVKTRLYRWMEEQIESGCIDNAEKLDVPLLLNHGGMPLARTSAGTMQISDKKDGLHFRAELDNSDEESIRIYKKIKRGDINGCSFAFTIADKGETYLLTDNGPDLRTILKIDRLIELSVVSTPAYMQTKVSARAMNMRGQGRWKSVEQKIRLEEVLGDAELRHRIADSE